MLNEVWATDAKQQDNTMATIAKLLKPIVSWIAQLGSDALRVCLSTFSLTAKRQETCC